jgi:SAM-dependent methyltransferase
MKSHERYRWAAGILDIRSDDNILEFGCGVGLAVEAIVPLLKKGVITAIDRSPLAIARAIQRNVDAVKLGKVKLLKAELLGFTNEGIKYNKAFCFNVNFFWTNKSLEKECKHIRSLLKKGGLVYIFYGPLIGKGFESRLQLISQNLEKENFEVVQSFYAERIRCCCIVARP